MGYQAEELPLSQVWWVLTRNRNINDINDHQLSFVESFGSHLYVWGEPCQPCLHEHFCLPEISFSRTHFSGVVSGVKEPKEWSEEPND